MTLDLESTTVPAVERVLECEVMDGEVEAREYDAMDFSDADRSFADRAAALVHGPRDAPLEIIDLGCGTGTIALMLADLFPNARIVGVDLAESMLSLAKAKLESRSLGHRVVLMQRDVKETGLPSGHFDLVISNSVLHHLPDPERLLVEMRRLVTEGGALLLCDLFRPGDEAGAWAIVDEAAPGDSPKQRQLFFDSLCAALTSAELTTLAERVGLSDMTIETISKRHLAASRHGTPRHGTAALGSH